MYINIRRKELIQIIGKLDPKTVHHNYNTYNIHLQLWPIGLEHRQMPHTGRLDWGISTTTPLKLKDNRLDWDMYTTLKPSGIYLTGYI